MVNFKDLSYLVKNGQIEQAVNYLLKEELSNENLLYIARESLGKKLFKGARRAIGHMTEPTKTNFLLNILHEGWGTYFYDYYDDKKVYHVAWLETIKMLPNELQNKELFRYIGEIVKTYVTSDELVALVKEACNLLDDKAKKRLLFICVRKKDLIINYSHNNNYEALFYIKILDGEFRDKVNSFVLRTILKFNQSKSFRYIDDNSIFTKVLSMGKLSDYTDRQMFDIAKSNIYKLFLGSNAYSGEEMTLKLSSFMPKEQAERFNSYASCLKSMLTHYVGKELMRNLKKIMPKEEAIKYIDYDTSLISVD
jgi:hypothetical protein